ncbi:MAG: alpha/beta hydrolase [Minwuia sp.]|nr:alpha/beta hydrolase [Minwuia sp.]
MIETKEFAVRGLRFTTDVAGAGKAPEKVLFLHGFPNSRHSWTDMLEAVAKAGFRGIAPDQRGYSSGARPEGIDAYQVEEMVADAIAIADAVGAERFHLVGHDWGGQIAWAAAALHPERLLSLTVLSRPHPAAFARAFRDDPAQASRSRHHKAFQDPAMADRLLKDSAAALRNTLCFENAAGLFGTEDPAAPERKRRMSDALASCHLSVLGTRAALDAALNWYRAAFAGGSTLARSDFPAIQVPTLYVWGREDMSVGEMAASLTPEHVAATCRFEALDGVGHFVAEEAPEATARLLIEHIQAHGSEAQDSRAQDNEARTDG